MRIYATGFGLLLALTPPLRAEVTVRVTGGRVDVISTTAPLAEVLDRLARQIGMKVVYDGASPRQLVTVSLLGRSPAEAVHDLLEGQGLNYALVADASGAGVQTLLMTGSTAAVSRPSSGSSGPRISAAPPPLSGADAADDPEDEPDEEPAQVPPAGTPPGVPNGAAEGVPPGVLPPGIAPSTQLPGGAASPFPAPGLAPPTANPRSIVAPPGVPGLGNVPAGAGRFVPVSPYSPLGPFVPALPAGQQGTTPGAPPEPEEPPL